MIKIDLSKINVKLQEIEVPKICPFCSPMVKNSKDNLYRVEAFRTYDSKHPEYYTSYFKGEKRKFFQKPVYCFLHIFVCAEHKQFMEGFKYRLQSDFKIKITKRNILIIDCKNKEWEKILINLNPLIKEL